MTRVILAAMCVLASATPAFASEWWFIYRVYAPGPARAAGPYASRELCQIAGLDAFPTDRRFMTAAQLVEDDARLKKERAERAATAERQQRLVAEKAKTAKREPAEGLEMSNEELVGLGIVGFIFLCGLIAGVLIGRASREWGEIPADFQHPSEVAPDGCYDDGDAA